MVLLDRPRGRFFLPVKVLGKVFRGKFVAGLRRAFGSGKLPSMANSKGLQIRDCSARSSARYTAPTGWSTQRSHSAGLSMRCNTWPATRIGWPSQTTVWCPLIAIKLRSAGRTMHTE